VAELLLMRPEHHKVTENAETHEEMHCCVLQCDDVSMCFLRVLRVFVVTR
jgi:hypothetical protein